MRREAGNSTNARDRCNGGVVYGDGVVMAQDGAPRDRKISLMDLLYSKTTKTLTSKPSRCSVLTTSSNNAVAVGATGSPLFV